MRVVDYVEYALRGVRESCTKAASFCTFLPCRVHGYSHYAGKPPEQEGHGRHPRLGEAYRLLRTPFHLISE